MPQCIRARDVTQAWLPVTIGRLGSEQVGTGRNRGAIHATFCWRQVSSLRSGRCDRPGRHGRSLQSPRYSSRSHRRHQGAPRTRRIRSNFSRAFRARGTCGLQLEPSSNAINPFLSADGQWVAFFANGKLLKVSVEGGAPFGSFGADWADDALCSTMPWHEAV